MMVYKNALELAGYTPEVKINRLFGEKANVFIKLGRLNPGGSIKGRIVLVMTEDAEAKGVLKKDTVIVEPTSGNTGVGLAFVTTVKGYKLIVVMPELVSIECRRLMVAYGAKVALTSKEKGTGGAVAKALELAAEHPDYWVPQQSQNPANPAVREATTAQKILQLLSEGFDYFVIGVGTGGHIFGTSKILKQHFPNLKTIVVELDQSAVLSGGKPGPYALQGLGTGFISNNYNPAVVDGVIAIPKEEAYDYTRRFAKQEGILAGISTGAASVAVVEVFEKYLNARILIVNYDTGECYWPVEGLY